MSRRKWYAVLAVVLFLVVFLIGLRAEAADWEYRAGLGTQVLDRADRGEHIAIEALVYRDRDLYLGLSHFGNGSVVPDTYRLAAGWRVEWREGSEFEPMMRFGMAYWHPFDSGLVTERWTYDMAVGVRVFRIVEVEWQHNSTAGRAERNTGVDLLMVSAVFPFR